MNTTFNPITQNPLTLDAPLSLQWDYTFKKQIILFLAPPRGDTYNGKQDIQGPIPLELTVRRGDRKNTDEFAGHLQFSLLQIGLQ